RAIVGPRYVFQSHVSASGPAAILAAFVFFVDVFNEFADLLVVFAGARGSDPITMAVVVEATLFFLDIGAHLQQRSIVRCAHVRAALAPDGRAVTGTVRQSVG